MKRGAIILNVLLLFLFVLLIYDYYYMGMFTNNSSLFNNARGEAFKFRVIDLFIILVILSIFAYTLFLNNEKYKYNRILTDYISPSPVLEYSNTLLSLILLLVGFAEMITGGDIYKSITSVFLISYGYGVMLFNNSRRRENKYRYYILIISLISVLILIGIFGVYYFNIFFSDFSTEADLSYGSISVMGALTKNLIVILAAMKVCEIFEYIMNI